MKGLWHISTRTIDPGLGIVVWDAMVTCTVVFCTGFLIIRKSKAWPEAWLLVAGLVLLSIWYIFQWMDVIIHQTKADVTYSYILFDIFNHTFRTFSDIFVLWGIWKVLIRYKHYQPEYLNDHSTFFSTLIAILLWVLGFYEICLSFGLSFVWLYFTDLHVIEAIAQARYAFELTFMALQFCATLFTVVAAFDRVNNSELSYLKEAESMVIACIALIPRSFCELVIVGQLMRDPAHISRILKARDILYGLFSVCFVIPVVFAVPKKGGDDPMVEDEKAAMQEVKNLFISELNQSTDQGQKTAPALLELLETVENRLPADQKLEIKKLQLREIKRLKKAYADWNPVYKWQGEAYDPGDESEALFEDDDDYIQSQQRGARSDLRPGSPIQDPDQVKILTYRHYITTHSNR